MASAHKSGLSCRVSCLCACAPRPAILPPSGQNGICRKNDTQLAVNRTLARFPDADIVFGESSGDNLAATFSPELSDLTIYVIDVDAGEKIPRKGGPGITTSDLRIINKTDLAVPVGANLDVMVADTM